MGIAPGLPREFWDYPGSAYRLLNDPQYLRDTQQAWAEHQRLASDPTGFLRMQQELQTRLSRLNLSELTEEQLDLLRQKGMVVSRLDFRGGYDYEIVHLGGQYLIYYEPWQGNYQLVGVVPDSVSLEIAEAFAADLATMGQMEMVEVGISILPGGSTAVHLADGEYGWAILTFVQDVGESLLVVGKLGELGKLPRFFQAGPRFADTRVLAVITITEGISLGANTYGAASSFLEGDYRRGAIHSLDAIFSLIGTSFSAREYLEAARRYRRMRLAEQVESAATVWHQIKPTQEVWPGTVIPRSFELTTSQGRKIWIHPNATKHLQERVKNMVKRGLSPELQRIGQQSQLTSLAAAVEAATRKGITYGEVIRVGGWELKFGRPRKPGQLPVLYHALPLE